MRKLLSAVVMAAMIPSFTSTANAGILKWNDLQPGKEGQSLEVGGITVGLQSEPHGVVLDPHGGAGAQGGGEDNEIGSADYWTFYFSEPVYIEKLKIGRLYTDQGPFDIINEGIQIISDNGTYEWYAVPDADGTIIDAPELGDDNAVVKVRSNGVDGEGQFNFLGDELFGGPVTQLTLIGSPQDIFPITGGGFLFFGMKFTPVPTPGTAALLGMGGLAVTRRRRR